MREVNPILIVLNIAVLTGVLARTAPHICYKVGRLTYLLQLSFFDLWKKNIYARFEVVCWFDDHDVFDFDTYIFPYIGYQYDIK